MSAITTTAPIPCAQREIDNLSICQTILLLIQKVKDAILRAFSYCWTSIKNICCCLRKRSISEIQPLVSYVQSVVSQRGKQEHLFLATRFDLQPWGSVCEHPRRIGCGTPSANQDHEQVRNQCRQVLFETLPFGIQNSLNALLPEDRASILDTALASIIKEYKNKVHLLENDLYQHFSQVGVPKRLKFKSDELDEPAKAILQKNLSGPLEQRLQSFSPFIQEALFNSAYCQMRKAATGKEDILYC